MLHSLKDYRLRYSRDIHLAGRYAFYGILRQVSRPDGQKFLPPGRQKFKKKAFEVFVAGVALAR